MNQRSSMYYYTKEVIDYSKKNTSLKKLSTILKQYNWKFSFEIKQIY